MSTHIPDDMRSKTDTRAISPGSRIRPVPVPVPIAIQLPSSRTTHRLNPPPATTIPSNTTSASPPLSVAPPGLLALFPPSRAATIPPAATATRAILAQPEIDPLKRSFDAFPTTETQTVPSIPHDQPRLVDLEDAFASPIDLAQFLHPRLAVLALGIVVVRLFDRVEHSGFATGILT
jgi:hypothetical protein